MTVSITVGLRFIRGEFMLITQAHIDFYRLKKLPCHSLQSKVKTPFMPKGYVRTETIDCLINSQVKDARKGQTEPHNINNFIRGWRSRGENVVNELYRLAYHPYGTDPERRTAYAKKWHARLTQWSKQQETP